MDPSQLCKYSHSYPSLLIHLLPPPKLDIADHLQQPILPVVSVHPRPHRRRNHSSRDLFFQTAAQAVGRFTRSRNFAATIGHFQLQHDAAYVDLLPLLTSFYIGMGSVPGVTGSRPSPSTRLLPILTSVYRTLAVGLAAFRRAVVGQTVSPDVMHYLALAGLACPGPANLVMAAAWSAVAYAHPQSPVMLDATLIASFLVPFMHSSAGLILPGYNSAADLLGAIDLLSEGIESLIELLCENRREFQRDFQQHLQLYLNY